MKIKFDSTLDYQKDGIESIVDVFQGQEVCEANFTVYSPEFLAKQTSLGFSEMGYGNRLTLNEGKILENIQHIQLANGLKPSERNDIDRNHLDFTVEMETGTGKTYVYLRTIMELYRKYGFSKHIIVVPSIPIKEGVHKSLEITKEHFRQLYDNINYNFFIYDSSKLSEVRDFSTNNDLEIMVINIDAFSKSFENPEDAKKKANIIHRYNDSLGYKPLDLIKNTNPIVFVDEPQTTMSTPTRKRAIKELNPLAVVRYSATHKVGEKNNMMYKLDAIDAYDKKLVKQIEVASLQAEGNNNQAYIRLLEVKSKKNIIQAKIEVDVFKNGSIKRKAIWVKQNNDLESIEFTGRTEYEGYIIKDIDATPGYEYIDFTSKEEVIKLGEAIGSVDDSQVKRAMIKKTIEEHLNKELILNPKGIKVLSLFFIDTVSKYKTYDEEGNKSNGEYAEIFEDEYQKLVKHPKYHSLFEKLENTDIEASEVHNGYFSIDKKSKKIKDSRTDKEGHVKANKDDEDTFSLIMRDKEMLLSFDSKLRFIFSHSALKEGWDNPNVFQICTLKDAGGSEMRRRQEIGRGLRLCVNQDGTRVYGHEVNTLTVMATESYADFVENLQTEIEKETGIRFGFIENHSFANVVTSLEDGESIYLGQEKSEELYNNLLEQEYIDIRGKVQDKLKIDLKEGNVELPEEFTSDIHIHKQILANLKEASGKLVIKDGNNKKKVLVNRQVLDGPEFKELWERVKYKTTFSVDYDSAKLINECIKAIDDRLIVSRGKLFYKKALVGMTSGAVEATETLSEESLLNESTEPLPDIVSYLQNETQLTRKSIVAILTGSKKIEYFKRNPQKFIEGCVNIINEQMRFHIIDGIQYKKIGDSEFYSQELFDNKELFGYLNSNLIESKNSPYEYVVYDSKVESKLVEYFEKSDNIPVYAKLPDWFKIDTPLGTYNPDWAIQWKDDEVDKLFFVVESKGTLDLDLGMRGKESSKIKCGKAHFKAIGSEMIVATGQDDVSTYALGIND